MITHVSAPCLLIGMPSMLDGNFIKTVLLLAEHNSEGAIGFILNRPSTVPLKSMLSLIDREVPSAIPAWYGGPVDTGTAIILHSRKPATNDTDVGQGFSSVPQAACLIRYWMKVLPPLMKSLTEQRRPTVA